MTLKPKKHAAPPAPSLGPGLHVAGQAALAICESLLLSLDDRKLMPKHEITGILRNAAAVHENAPDDADGLHKGVVELITRMIDYAIGVSAVNPLAQRQGRVRQAGVNSWTA